MKPYKLIPLFLCGLLYSSTIVSQVGENFPSWTEGFLDIHHINTGKGESVFFIMPDGTTMLVDAGYTTRSKPRVTDPKPNGTINPGEWIARYVLHMMKELPSKKLDYILLTHFDGDHMGDYYPNAKTSKSGKFKLTGVTEVGEFIQFRKIVDRGWPDYNWPRPLDNEKIKNYRQFIGFNTVQNNSVAEKFQVGQNTQFSLVNKRDKYPNFEVRNLAANGHIWAGTSTIERNYFPPLESLQSSEYPSENMCSIAFRLSYGKFDYFNGGDIPSGKPNHWNDIETPLSQVTGPVEICEANHHAFYDAMSESFLSNLRPRIIIMQSYSPSHPSIDALSRMLSTSTYPGPRDIFATNVMEETKVVIGPNLDKLKSQQGHIVVRVNPGGGTYMIYILDDSKESFKIIAAHGPYSSN